ncbi:MAG: metallophosphoesterase [Actinomycetes bacterium]
MSKDYKYFFATDIHGSEVCLKKFLNSGKFYDVDAIIMGGDITGKMIVPVVQGANGNYSASLFGRKRVVQIDELPLLIKMISDAGFYPHQMSEDELQHLKDNPASVDALFSELMKNTIANWLDLAENRLQGTGIEVIFAPGNDDPFFIDEMLSSNELVINPDGQVIELPGGFPMISIGYSNITPWSSPRELEESALQTVIDQQVAKLDNLDNAIFNLHVPPKDTTLDQAFLLDDEFRPVMKSGSPVIAGVGSSAVRDSLQKYQPLMSLHGHIHESRGEARLGRTLAINPGSEYSEGILRGVIVSMSAKKGVKGYQFVSG